MRASRDNDCRSHWHGDGGQREGDTDDQGRQRRGCSDPAEWTWWGGEATQTPQNVRAARREGDRGCGAIRKV